MRVWLKKHWEETRGTSAVEGTRHVSLWNNVGVRDSSMPSDGFEPKSHTVLRLGAAMIVVVATTADIAFAGATKKVAWFSHQSLPAHWLGKQALGSVDGCLHGQPSAPCSSLQCGMQTENIT